MTVESEVPPVAMQYDLRAAFVRMTEEGVEQPTSVTAPRRYRSKVVDTPPEAGPLWQQCGQCQLVLVRAEGAPTGHEPAHCDDSEPDPNDRSDIDSSALSYTPNGYEQDRTADDRKHKSDQRGSQHAEQLSSKRPAPPSPERLGPKQDGIVAGIGQHLACRPPIDKLDRDPTEQLDSPEQRPRLILGKSDNDDAEQPGDPCRRNPHATSFGTFNCPD
jgi:hypothetical protein